MLVQVFAVVLACAFLQFSEAVPRVPIQPCDCSKVCSNGRRAPWFCSRCDCANLFKPQLCPLRPCPKGRRCVKQEIYCFVAPCPPPTYRCVPECGPVCANYCPYGRKFENNCPTCECELTPCATVRCSAGYECQASEVGDCTEAPCPRSTAQCVPTATNATDTGCGPVCDIWCEYGREFDENNCPTCTCKPNPCAFTTCFSGNDCVVSNTGDCTEQPCPVATAECVPATANVTECGAVCEIYCQYGREFDENNCPTCNCKPNPCALTLCPKDTTCVATEVGDCTVAPCPEATADCVPACSPMCTKEYKPVCGSDGTTYGNDCMMRYATCKSSGTIVQAYSGACNT